MERRQSVFPVESVAFGGNPMRRRISLVVDDDSSIRGFVKAILQREGFEILEADGGNPALEMVRALGESIDLIITDIQMAKGDGLTFATIARDLYPSTAIILMSGYADPDNGLEFVQKPFTWETIAKVVRRLTREQAA
jgi:DNA-binding NtrC family response regulator